MGVTPLWICQGALPLCPCTLRLYVISLRTRSPALEADNVAPCVGQAEVPSHWVCASLIRQPRGDLTWWDELSSLGSLQMFVVIIRKCANTPINLIDMESWLGRKLIFFPKWLQQKIHLVWNGSYKECKFLMIPLTNEKVVRCIFRGLSWWKKPQDEDVCYRRAIFFYPLARTTAQSLDGQPLCNHRALSQRQAVSLTQSKACWHCTILTSYQI